MPDKKTLQAQLGILRRVFKEKVKPDDKDDFNWTPNRQRKPKKSEPKPMSKIVFRLDHMIVLDL